MSSSNRRNQLNSSKIYQPLLRTWRRPLCLLATVGGGGSGRQQLPSQGQERICCYRRCYPLLLLSCYRRTGLRTLLCPAPRRSPCGSPGLLPPLARSSSGMSSCREEPVSEFPYTRHHDKVLVDPPVDLARHDRDARVLQAHLHAPGAKQGLLGIWRSHNSNSDSRPGSR